MTVALTSLAIALDQYQLAGSADTISVVPTFQEREITTFASGGFGEYMTSTGRLMIGVEGFDSWASTTSVSNIPQAGALQVFSVSQPGATAGDESLFGLARTFAWKSGPSGAVGDISRFALDIRGTRRIVDGLLLHPSFARTSTGSGTAVAFTAPTATQALHAAFHVHSVTGSGTITFTIQTDDNSGMTTPTTRITSAGFTAVGASFASLSGALAGETHIRAGWTITGFTSVTFSIVAGVGLP